MDSLVGSDEDGDDIEEVIAMMSVDGLFPLVPAVELLMQDTVPLVRAESAANKSRNIDRAPNLFESM